MKDSKLRVILRTMPSLRHSIPGQPFDYSKSEVVKWLLQRPEMMDAVFSLAKDTDCIRYDKTTGMWSGVPKEGA